MIWNKKTKREKLNIKHIFQIKESKSYFNKVPWTTDKNERKYRHIFINLFPVWADTVIHCKEERQLTDRIEMKINKRELKKIYKRKYEKV